MRIVALTALLVVLSACASRSVDVTATPMPRDTSTAMPTQERLTGALGGDADLEGGCVWLETADGDRIEVVWPDGYQATADPIELRDATGEVIATDGDVIAVDGTPANDRVSTCQIGDIWVAATVERLPGS